MDKHRDDLRCSVQSWSLIAAGLLVMWFSVPLGTWKADRHLRAVGSMDTPRFTAITEGCMHTFLLAGAVMFGAGLLLAIRPRS